MADKASVKAKYDAWIVEVQAIGSSPPPPPPPVLAVGARCKVTKSPSAVIRATANASAPASGTQAFGAQGVIVAPGLVAGGWWVRFDAGVGQPGWVWAANIAAI